MDSPELAEFKAAVNSPEGVALRAEIKAVIKEAVSEAIATAFNQTPTATGGGASCHAPSPQGGKKA